MPRTHLAIDLLPSHVHHLDALHIAMAIIQKLLWLGVNTCGRNLKVPKTSMHVMSMIVRVVCILCYVYIYMYNYVYVYIQTCVYII